MPRPQKFRFVCNMPETKEFIPKKNICEKTVVMSIDEYEVLRLIDYEKNTQEECSQKMNIARTTVQNIYERARYKLADTLINGKRLLIEGGNVKICSHKRCGCQENCPHHKCKKGEE